MQIPRIDVSNSALIGAVTGLLMLVLTASTMGTAIDWWVALPPLLVVVVMAVVAWAVESAKEWAGSAAGALLIIVQFVISARRGEVVDAALVTAAVTYFVQLFFLWALPRIQPRRQGILTNDYWDR